MNDQQRLLAARKQVLVAQAALQRTRLQLHAHDLREGMRLPRTAGVIAASPHGRKLALGLALMLFKGGKIGRLLRFGLGAAAIVKLAQNVYALNHRP